MPNIPSIYSKEQRDQMKQTILDRMAEGVTLAETCKEEGMPPHRTVYYWLDNDPAFREAYDSARRTIRYPASYVAEMKEEICLRISLGETLTSILKDEHTPTARDLYRWLREDPEFEKGYAQARIDMADALVDKALDVHGKYAPDQHGMARVEGNIAMLAAEKLNPRKYSTAQRIELASTFIPADQLLKIKKTTNNFSSLPDRPFGMEELLQFSSDAHSESASLMLAEKS